MIQAMFPAMVEPAKLALAQAERELEATKAALKEKKTQLKEARAIWMRVSGEKTEHKLRKPSAPATPQGTPSASGVTKGAKS
ncbi:MAG: hypothetical protein AB1806_05055 [Acidobacteriota bacterium]